MNVSFRTTRKKLVLFFSISSSFFVFLTTLGIIIFIRFQMNANAKNTLQGSLSQVSEGFQKDQLQEKKIEYQKKNSIIPRSRSNQLPNIDDYDKQYVQEKNKAMIDGKEMNFEKLKENKEVFSRVVSASGDILFTSDIFEKNYINPEGEGFSRIVEDGVCIYSYAIKIRSGKKEGSIVQVAQYCPFSIREEINLFVLMLLVMLLVFIGTYFGGVFVSALLMKPLQKSVEQTRSFVRHCYHELLTPITIAMTSVQAAFRLKKYRAGLESVEQDLLQIYNSLNFLNNCSIKDRNEFSKEEIEAVSILNKIILIHKRKYLDASLSVNTDEVDNQVKILANKTSLRFVFQNLIDNAFKFCKKDGEIKVVLNKKSFKISNEVEQIEQIDRKRIFEKYYRGKNSSNIEGKGLGLALVKEMVDLQGWKVEVTLKEGRIVFEIIFV